MDIEKEKETIKKCFDASNLENLIKESKLEITHIDERAKEVFFTFLKKNSFILTSIINFKIN